MGGSMYYVIQIIHGVDNKYFASYEVPKYILSEKNTNIIFEFGEKPNVKRKWAPKEDIVLITRDRRFFNAYVEKLIKLESSHLEEIKKAQAEVERLKQRYEEHMNAELHSFKKLSETNKKIPNLI